MWRIGAIVLVLMSSLACKAPPEAPTELNELSRYLYREWPTEDPEVLAVGVRNLETFLADFDVSAEASVQDRSWELTPLIEEDVEGITRPEDRALEDLLAVSVAMQSQWSIEDHARVQTEADQRPFEPTAKDHYDRFFLEPDDEACFIDGSCELMRTRNEATRSNILFTVTFELLKDFRWIELEEGRRAFLSRSWFEQPWSGEKENTTLWQSFSTDLWIEQEDGTALRYQALWSESEVGAGENDALVLGTVKIGANDIFQRAEEKIGELYHPEPAQ